ncbi:hypothetical protein [Rhizobium sp. Leaf341]|uniref:hypothetical protein n=1 Tax=Rhizobium sp. Leaf341 TaxID=1736344 RepID=UPI000ACBAC1E|nr:hypothetical protein [Rhizobium sp. Leaf341]
MRYEAGMAFFFDVFSKSVLITFRGREYTLQGPYPTQRVAFQAAEQFCLDRGWVDPHANTDGRQKQQ